MMSCACEWVETRSTETAGEKGPRSARLSLQLGNTAITLLLIQGIEMEWKKVKNACPVQRAAKMV